MKKLERYIESQYNNAVLHPGYAKTYMELSYGAIMYYLYENNDKNYEKVSEMWDGYKNKFEKIIFNI